MRVAALEYDPEGEANWAPLPPTGAVRSEVTPVCSGMPDRTPEEGS